MCIYKIYMGVRKFGPFQYQNSGHSYTFFLKKGGGYHISEGAEKGGYSARTFVLCHI